MKQPISLPHKSIWPKTVQSVLQRCLTLSWGDQHTLIIPPFSGRSSPHWLSSSHRGCWGKESVVSRFPSLTFVLFIAPSYFSALAACLETVA